MSIATFVEAAIGMQVSRRMDLALALTCSAVDATAGKVFSVGKDQKKLNNNQRYKAFLRANLSLITRFGFPGIIADGIRIRYTAPSGSLALEHDMKPINGYVGIEDVIYHTVRCGLLHACEVDQRIRFTMETIIGDFGETFSIPAAMVTGLLASVVLHPANKAEMADAAAKISLDGDEYPLNHLWGTGISVIRCAGATQE